MPFLFKRTFTNDINFNYSIDNDYYLRCRVCTSVRWFVANKSFQYKTQYVDVFFSGDRFVFLIVHKFSQIMNWKDCI